MGCPSCGRGFHSECSRCKKNKCHPVAKPPKGTEVLRGVGRPLKEPHEQKDPLSTGRKRAAHLWPLFEGEPCEWKGKRNCGGGKFPIVGCRSGTQEHRHHGPVKDTRHNEPGNVHRVCRPCHRRWHASNDKEYNAKLYADLPHSPQEATETDLEINEAYWKTPHAKRLVKKEPDKED